MLLCSVYSLQGSITNLSTTVETELIKVQKELKGIWISQQELQAMIAGQERNWLAWTWERMLLQFRYLIHDKGGRKLQHSCVFEAPNCCAIKTHSTMHSYYLSCVGRDWHKRLGIFEWFY